MNHFKLDLYRYEGKVSVFIFLKRVVFTPGYRYIFLMRLCKKSYSFKPFYLPLKMMLRFYSRYYGFQISDKVSIGKGFYIGHYGTTIVNDNAIIGENCNIAPGVVVGQTNRGTKKGTPIIGNFVWMGINSIIVGGINIGNNVLIAPGAYVNFDVPDNSIVMGNPGKIIPNINPTNGYIDNPV